MKPETIHRADAAERLADRFVAIALRQFLELGLPRAQLGEHLLAGAAALIAHEQGLPAAVAALRRMADSIDARAGTAGEA